MNTQDDNTTPDAAPAADEPTSIAIDSGVLELLDVRQLRGLGAAIRTLQEVASGLTCQPRFIQMGQYTPAGHLLEELCVWLASYEEAIFQAAKSAPTPTSMAVEDRAFCLIEGIIARGDDLGHVSVAAAQGACDHAMAIWRERRAA